MNSAALSLLVSVVGVWDMLKTPESVGGSGSSSEGRVATLHGTLGN